MMALMFIPFSLANSDAKTVSMIKFDKNASSGSCMIKPIKSIDEANKLIKKYNFLTSQARDNEKINLANGLAQISALNGGVLEAVENVKLDFIDDPNNPSRFRGFRDDHYHFRITRCRNSKKECRDINTAMLMHELGHRLGKYKKNEKSFYSLYRKQVKSCYPTRYARKNLFEQFAEAFAAYITNPELLLGKGEECKKAYEFFEKSIFPVNGHLSSCDKSKMFRLFQSNNSKLSGDFKAKQSDFSSTTLQ